MSLGISIDFRDEISPVLQRLGAGISGEQINPVVGRSARNVYVGHFRQLNTERPNALGGKRTNYYLGAARATQFRVVDEGVIVSINEVGIAQRYFGGTIRPKTAKYLTIPVHPAAYGHRASEFDLELVFGAGGQPIALATKKTTDVQIRQGKRGQVTRKNVTRFGEIYFRLAKSITQKADPTVLPTSEKLREGVLPDLTAYLGRLIERRGGTS